MNNGFVDLEPDSLFRLEGTRLVGGGREGKGWGRGTVAVKSDSVRREDDVRRRTEEVGEGAKMQLGGSRRVVVLYRKNGGRREGRG